MKGQHVPFVTSSLELDAIANDLIPSRLALEIPAEGKGGAATNSILVTGGAGFLGVHLLCELVTRGGFERIYTVARQPAKLTRQLLHFGLDEKLLEKVTVIEADLCTVPLESLPVVAVVVHCAAQIHCIKGLSQLWQNNVQATERILEAYRGRARVFLISTLSVFVSSNLQGEHLPVEAPVTDKYKICGGYAQSKYICERLGHAAGADIIRLGLLTGSSHAGRFPESDFFSCFVKTIRELGGYPAEYEQAWVDLTPVDLAASLILDRIEQGGPTGITHIANKVSASLGSILDVLRVPRIANEAFSERLERLPSLIKVLLNYAFFKSASLQAWPQYFNVDLFQSTGHTFGIDQPFPVSNAELLSLYNEVMGS